MKNKYVFKEWEIKQSDTITINQYLLSENQSIKKVYTVVGTPNYTSYITKFNLILYFAKLLKYIYIFIDRN